MRHSYEQDFCLRHEKTGPQKKTVGQEINRGLDRGGKWRTCSYPSSYNPGSSDL